MMSYGRRAVSHLTQLRLLCVGSRAALSSSNLGRANVPCHVLQPRQILNIALKSGFTTRIYRRAYADKAVSRPKAHTGRKTAVAKKAPTTSKTKVAKKPTPKTKVAKARPKAKSKTKTKGAKKAKSKPRRKPKVLTEAQKGAAIIKKLKSTALEPPHKLPSNAWSVLLTEATKEGRAIVGQGQSMKTVSEEFKRLTPERLEHYNHIANQNKASNERTYHQWVESHTPAQIHEANLARLSLKRRKVKGYYKLHDDRQVKGRVGAHLFFNKDRFASGDMKGLKRGEAFALAAREWKGLSASEKKPYEDAAKQDQARFIQEYKTVYNRDPRPQAAAAAA